MPVYFYLIIFTTFFPLVLSFDKRVRFVQYWPAFFMAMLPVAAFFLVWDYFFTAWGVWGFNQQYLLGINIANLPLEEMLFFVVVPFACIFIYQCFRYYIPKDYLKPAAPYISAVLAITLPIIALFHIGALYTSVTFLLAAALLVLAQFVFKVKWMGWFYLAYFVSLVPFLIVNGILTSLPVVWYNNAHNLGIRLYTIPIEDTMYSLLLLLMNVWLYEGIKNSKLKI
jgi:lycopene cyclase domain-containing protein